MSVVEVLERIGGVATRATLLRVCERAEVDRALQAGDVVAARGRYSLPAAEESWVAAQRVGGVCSHQSAALHLGWEVLVVPKAPEITVPKHRRLTDPQCRDEVRAVLEAVVEVRTDSLCPGCRPA